MNSLRVAFLGGGTMALRQAAALLDAGLPRSGLVSVYDRDVAVAHAFADRFGATPMPSSRAALQVASHVVIATTAGSHASDAFEALTMRRGVFVEKPLALTVRDGAALTILAERLSLPLHVGLSERFHPVVRALANSLANTVEARRVTRIETVRNLRSMRARDCSVAMNLAVHDVDLALTLTHEGLTLDTTHAAQTVTGLSSFHARFIGARGEAVSIAAADGVSRDVRTITVTVDSTTFEGDLLAGTLSQVAMGVRTPVLVERVSGLVSQASALLSVWTGRQALGPATARDAFRGLALLARATRTAHERAHRTPENLPPFGPFG